MALGYKFAMKLPPVKRPIVTRKPSAVAETIVAKKVADAQQQKPAPATPAMKKRKSVTPAEGGAAKRTPRRKPAAKTAPRVQQPKMPPVLPGANQFMKPMQLQQQTSQTFFQQQPKQTQQQPPQQQYQPNQQQTYQQQQQYQNAQSSAKQQYQQQQHFQQPQQQFQATQQQQVSNSFASCSCHRADPNPLP